MIQAKRVNARTVLAELGWSAPMDTTALTWDRLLDLAVVLYWRNRRVQT